MDVSVSEAKGLLTELVRRAETGEDIILTRHGRPVVRLGLVAAQQSKAERRALLQSVRQSASARTANEPEAARSQDFLYGSDGLPV